MKLSFDGIRMTLADQFNELAETELSDDQREIMRDLRMTIGGLLAAYDPQSQPDDCNMLADTVQLVKIVDLDGLHRLSSKEPFRPKYSQEQILEMVKQGKVSMWDAAAYQFIPEGEPDSWVEDQRAKFRAETGFHHSINFQGESLGGRRR